MLCCFPQFLQLTAEVFLQVVAEAGGNYVFVIEKKIIKGGDVKSCKDGF